MVCLAGKARLEPAELVFAPVWTFLYISMGVAAWQVWMSVGVGSWLVLYALQLALNMEWTYLFFGERRPDWAFAEIFILWATILATMVAFWRIDAVAGWLFLPYLLWVTFASTLNGAVWRLNRDNSALKPTA